MARSRWMRIGMSAVVIAVISVCGWFVVVHNALAPLLCFTVGDQGSMVETFEDDPLYSVMPEDGQLSEETATTYDCDNGHGGSPTTPQYAQATRSYTVPNVYNLAQLHGRFTQAATAAGWLILEERDELAGRGVHRPGERPFLTPWTEGTSADRARSVLLEHWHQLASWDVAAWRLGMAVFCVGRPIGAVTLRARDFPVVRQVTTSSWLGMQHQGKGYGTEARVGLLTLAFDHLGASAALTEVFQDNHSSQGVSRKLGYEHDGISVDARDGEAIISDRLRLSAQRWRQQKRLAVTVDGIDSCRASFGL